VLDPCCGTGAYLVEVLKTIHTTLRGKGEDALIGEYLKRIARDRVFGFEILPAPFVIAHLQLGLLLQNLGAPLSDRYNERVGIYLRNALTGWQPGKGSRVPLAFPEFVAERDAAAKVKRDEPILVVIGNPPYNSFAGVSPAEELGLVEAYKEGLVSKWGIKKFNLDDLYIRFLRLAERRIAEITGRGIVCFISNFSYLSDPSFVVMRKRFLDEFDKLWFDCMNGDSRETGKLTPEGQPDPSVFSTDQTRVGIRVGTTIGLMLRLEKRDKQTTVYFRNFWGTTKRADLLKSLKAKRFNAQYDRVLSTKLTRYSFRPSGVTADYLNWPRMIDLADSPKLDGLLEMRRSALRHIDKAVLEQRIRMYLDPQVKWEQLKVLGTGLTENAARFDAKKTREKLLARETFGPSHIVRYTLRPFETVWCYHSLIRPLWNEPRPGYWAQLWEGNAFIVSRPYAPRDPEGAPLFFARGLVDYNFFPPASVFPIRIRPVVSSKVAHKAGLFKNIPDSVPHKTLANISRSGLAYLSELGIPDPGAKEETAGLIWMHVLATGFAPGYITENTDGIRQDWPRIPLPGSKKALLSSADLGRLVAALLDTENEVPGVTSGTPRPELKLMGVVTRSGKGRLDPSAGHLDLTAGWGHAGKGGVTMPGKGRVVARDYGPEELKAIPEGTKPLGLAPELALKHLGENTRDIYLNADAYWKNVPARVWEYTIGGYQVIKKWLSYREKQLLGRALTIDEVREVTNMVRRIAAILLLEPQLDENYRQVKAHAYPWGQGEGATHKLAGN
jgi:hypothetical protein